MARPWQSWLLILGLSALAGAADEVPPLSGSPRFFGGRTVHRTVRLGTGPAPVSVRWEIVAFGAPIARGVQQADSRTPMVEIVVPEVARRVPAVLRVAAGEERPRRVSIEIYPSAREEIRAAFHEEKIGVVAPEGSSPGVDDTLAKVARLATPAELRNHVGRVLVLAGGAWDVRPFLPELLARVRSGARVLALGPSTAPWLRPEGASDRAPVEANDLLRDLGTDPLAQWGDEGNAERLALRSARGNHVEWIPGLVRDCLLGRGRIVLTGLPVAAHVPDEPVAAQLLARLVRRMSDELPRLDAPRAVRRVAPDDDTESLAMFGEVRGNGPTVLTSLPGGSEETAKRDAPVLVLGKDRTLFFSGADSLSGAKRVEGPGLERIGDFEQFATRIGLRLEADLPWSAP